MRLKSFDNLLIGLMSFSALVCLYMLYGVKYFARDNRPELSIASIIEQVNTVKRKKDFYQSWMDVNSGDGLAQNDEIYTHGQSSAKIHFNNGPEVQLFENSLLRIKSNTVSLEKGNLSAKLSPDAKKLDVLLNGKSYSFESSNANIQIEQGKTENKFLITDGDARMKLGEKAELLKPNQVLIQNKKSGEIKVKDIPFILSSPAQGMVSWFVQERTLDFAWSFRGDPVPVKFLLARDSNFEKIVLSEEISDNHFSTTLKEGGNYFWKIATGNLSDEISSPTRSLTLKEEKPLSLQLDKEILYKGPKANATVSLHWPRGEARHYELKISEGGEVNILGLDQNHYDYQATKIGETKFAVRVKEDTRPEALWSSTATLNVLEAKSISITSGLSNTLEKVNYTNKEFSQLLSWNGPSSGITYTIKVRHDGNEKVYKTDSISYPLQLSSAGDYDWNVQGETDSGVVTNVIGGKITVKAPLKLSQTPSEGAVIELEKPDQTVAFKWDSSEGRDAVYSFELASDPNFQKTILSKESESNSLSTTVGQTGKYYWRVKIKKGDKSEYSAPVSVDIRPTPPLARPEITPNLKIKMKVLEKDSTTFHFIDLFIAKAYADEPVTVAEWDLPANSRAKSYIVEIYEDQSLSKLLTRIETATPHIVWKNAKSGTFYWRMSYEDYWGRKTDFSKTAVIETSIDESLIKKPVVEIPPPPPIELVSPKHREEILENEDDVAEFKWDAIPDVKTYLFQMARDLDFKEMLFTKKNKDTALTLHCKDINSTEGELYWKVTTDNSTSKRRMVRTSCHEKKKPEPEIITPVVEPVAEVVPKKPEPKRLARVSFNPHHLGYTNKATDYSVDVSGNVLNSWEGFYQNFADLKYFSMFSFDATVSRGKVFKTFTFTDMDINLRFHRVKDNFHYGPVISISKKTLYEEENLAIKNKSASSPLVGVFAMKDFENVHTLAEIKFAGAMDVYAEALINVKKNYSAGPFIHLTSLSKDGGKHQFTAFGVKLAYTFLFLDEAVK